MGEDVGLPLVGLMHCEVRPWGTHLLRDSLEKVKSIQEKLLAAKAGKRNMQIERLETWSLWRVNKSY